MKTKQSTTKVLSAGDENQQSRLAPVTGCAYENFGLVSMLEFVFMLRNKTTSELVTAFSGNFVLPKIKPIQAEIVNDFLAVDAIQWRLTGEYGKFLRRELNKNQFDQDHPECLFKGFKVIQPFKTYKAVSKDFIIDLETLECEQFVEGGSLDFTISGHCIEAVANIMKGIKLTDFAVKQIFGWHCR